MGRLPPKVRLPDRVVDAEVSRLCFRFVMSDPESEATFAYLPSRPV
jgi:hypothetical protein